MKNLIISSSDKVFWTKDSHHIIVVNEKKKEVFVLRGLNAALWSWMCLSYSYGKICKLVVEATEVDKEEAEKTILTIIDEWEKKDLIFIREVEYG